MNSLRRSAVVLATLLGLTVVGFGVRSLAIAYHRKEMTASMAMTSMQSFEHHRDWLVSLGYLEREVFPLHHVQTRTPEWRALFKALDGVNTNVADGWFSMSGYEANSETQVVVWAHRQFLPAYQRIIAERDR